MRTDRENGEHREKRNNTKIHEGTNEGKDKYIREKERKSGEKS